MGHPDKARKVTWLTFLVTAAVATVLIVTPDALGRILGFGTHALWYFVFPHIHHREFEEWTASNADIAPSNGWEALKWGFLGIVIYFAIAVLMVVLLDLLGLLGES